MSSEVIAIKHHIVTRHGGSLQEIIGKISTAVKKIASDDSQNREFAKITCPMLNENGECLIYECRPVACRPYVSNDLENCKKYWDSPQALPFIGMSAQLKELELQAYGQMMEYEKQLGIPPNKQELILALHNALTYEH